MECVVGVLACAAAPKPHLVFVLQDDLGWHDTGLTNPSMLAVSPNITALGRDGVMLTNHLVHYHCSPTRRSFLSGRLPIHHGEQLSGVATDDIDLRWNIISQKLSGGGYLCHWVGKAHTGFLSTAHLPTARSFDSFIGFLGGSQSYFSEDRWEGSNGTTRPLLNRTGGGVDEYSSDLYGAAAVQIVREHPLERPLFLYLAWQAVHSPYSPVPHWDNDRTDFLPYPGVYAGMIQDADKWTGRLAAELKRRGMWQRTLMVYCSDNGGVSVHHLAGNNYPLRGEKHSNWNGGFRVLAFATGGLVPPALRGTSSNLRVSVVDWYPTFANLAGVDPNDDSPIPPLPVDPADPGKDIYGNVSYPGIDGTDIWPLLTGSPGSDFRAHMTLVATA